MLQGWLDDPQNLILSGTLSGWVCDPENASPLDLQIYIDRRLFKEIRADQYREDLVQAGIGDGRSGFNLRIPVNTGVQTHIQVKPQGEYLFPNGILLINDGNITRSSIDTEIPLPPPELLTKTGSDTREHFTMIQGEFHNIFQ